MMAHSGDIDITEYVATQVVDCTLTDGYVCAEIGEDAFTSRESLAALIPAVYFPAWQAAYQAFMNIEQLSASQKELKHYRIGLSESEESYIILFSALLMPKEIIDNKPQGITNITYGQTTKFWISKQSLQVSKFLFYR